MEKPITIKKLNDIESKNALKDKKFSRLHPVSCTQCGETIAFKRELFKITGVSKADQSDDSIQGVIRQHMKQRYSIEFIFFKNYKSKFIVDSSSCVNCGSSAITYDINLNDPEIAAELYRFIGKPQSEILEDMKSIEKSLKR